MVTRASPNVTSVPTASEPKSAAERRASSRSRAASRHRRWPTVNITASVSAVQDRAVLGDRDDHVLGEADLHAGTDLAPCVGNGAVERGDQAFALRHRRRRERRLDDQELELAVGRRSARSVAGPSPPPRAAARAADRSRAFLRGVAFLFFRADQAIRTADWRAASRAGSWRGARRALTRDPRAARTESDGPRRSAARRPRR